MPYINSISNNRIKEILKLHQKKYRDELGLFIVEGFKAIEELIENNIYIKEIYTIKAFDTEKYTVKIIDESTMKKISTTSSTCEILAVAKKKEYNINDFIKRNKLILLDSISDPGNLGTIIRSASAFGIDGIILYKDCVDMYSSKVIRSAAGNFFKIPIIIIKNTEEIKNKFKDFNKIATALYEKNTNSIEECKNIKKYIIMFGSEANGLSSELIKLANKNIILKMNNNVESLNLSVSASIIMYELFT